MLTARATGQSARFWGGEEQNHNDHAQAHHEAKDIPPEFVSRQPPSDWVFARGLWANRLLCNSAQSAPIELMGAFTLSRVSCFVKFRRLPTISYRKDLTFATA